MKTCQKAVEVHCPVNITIFSHRCGGRCSTVIPIIPWNCCSPGWKFVFWCCFRSQSFSS